jgi:hypothetical protein
MFSRAMNVCEVLSCAEVLVRSLTVPRLLPLCFSRVLRLLRVEYHVRPSL